MSITGRLEKFPLALAGAALLAMTLVTSPAMAAEAAKPRPVWRSWNARTHEDMQSKYLLFLTTVYQEELKAWKRAGLLLDYKILVREPRGPEEPDITIMYKYAGLAAMDRPSREWTDVGEKALERFKNDPEAQAMIANSDSLRRFIGWSPLAREVLLDE